MTPRQRLSFSTLVQARADVVRPVCDPRDLRLGLVHLGIGAFHRAHQAVFTELAAAATGDTRWGIAAATQRSAAVADQLIPQDCLYTVLDRGRDQESLRVVGAVRQVIDGRSDPQSLVAAIAAPEVAVITLTVTEKGYRRGPDGGLDLNDAQTAADLGPGTAQTAIGRLVRGLQRREATDAPPVTVLTCDNLVGNGAVLRRLVTEFIARLPTAERRPLLAWVESSVRFPSCMVDRIVPATTAADLAEVADRLGLIDRASVVAEPFSQWVIEDDFAADRPAWELAGAVFTTDVASWEAVKLRVLNGTHSMLAYLGALRGHLTIADALRDAELADLARALIRQDVIPTLEAPAGLDLADYGRQVLDRFANPALRHTTEQVAMDGSQKLPLRLLGTIRDRLAAGAMPRHATLAVAGWMVYVAHGADRDGRKLTLNDPLAAQLHSAVTGAAGPAAVVDALLGIQAIFDTDLPEHLAWRTELIAAFVDLTRKPMQR